LTPNYTQKHTRLHPLSKSFRVDDLQMFGFK
jgi:hypothetical protein